jgi:hypothetical protein
MPPIEGHESIVGAEHKLQLYYFLLLVLRYRLKLSKCTENKKAEAFAPAPYKANRLIVD